MKIIIVGGGIGGLCAALALRQHDIEVVVLEQAARLKEVGAGVQIASNGAVVLRHLGLEDKLAALATQPKSWEYYDMESGQPMVSWPVGADAARRYGAPLYNVHRADLVQLMVDALPPETVKFGAKCKDFGQDAAGVWVQLESGERIEGHALIGGDGIHSIVRDRLFGPADASFAKLLVWRALIPAERMPEGVFEERGNYWVGPGRSIVSYWVRPGELYSFLASVPATEVQRESWADSGDVKDLLKSFEGAEPRVQRMLEAIDRAFITGMYYRDPLERWTDGRITLMGDAAHAMVPYLAQGACQAIEDAWVLAVCLSRHGEADVQGGLAEYEERRRPRTTRIQAAARSMVKLVHEMDAERIKARNGRWKGMARIDPLGETTWSFCWGYDVTEEVKQPTGNVLGHTGTREGAHMQRPESQRAFNLWKGTFSPEDVARGYDGMREAYDRMFSTNFPPPPDLHVHSIQLNGVPCLQVMDSVPPTGQTILHFHGGAYVLGSAKSSLEYAARLAQSVGGSCISVEYRLAPEHPYPAAIDDALGAYRGLLATGMHASEIILSGESSGGGMAVALAIAIRDAGMPSPAGIFAAGPFVDLTLSSPSLAEFHGEDAAANRDMLSYLAASYFQGHEPTDPMVSPLFGDLRGLPPMLLVAATNEVLRDDTTRLAERARTAGVEVTLCMVDDSVHVFPLFGFLPEAKAALDQLRQWARAHRTISPQELQAA
ncbi:MAG: steryl acetyl hydrolase [Alcaligenaceae bacterium]|nr:MAG: steryl acetyl hydrolase [Alcaligenaceae bacterium]